MRKANGVSKLKTISLTPSHNCLFKITITLNYQKANTDQQVPKRSH
jgi:hypothetical protein